MNQITLNRGELLALVATPKNGGLPIVLDGTWTVAAAIAMESTTAPATDMGAAIADGKVSVAFDTVALAPGSYLADIRLTHPASGDQWTEKIGVTILQAITPPSPR